MRLSNLFPTRAAAGLVLTWCLAASASSYFIINEPTSSSAWVNGVANPASWSKGLLDGVDSVDIELARMSQDGLILVARDVPANQGSALNILLQDVPAANDYFLLFINSTHGVMYAISPQFSIIAAGSPANASQPKAIASAPTVTVSGGPNPTAVFATTFPPSQNGVVETGWRALHHWTGAGVGMAGAVSACLFGAAWTVW